VRNNIGGGIVMVFRPSRESRAEEYLRRMKALGYGVI
jgi:hypothetical protein